MCRIPCLVSRKSWAQDCTVLCLDEFFVSDIADAMLLAGLLKELFAQGVTLVTTSNIEPDGLYRNGLQRAKFLPAIELIKQHTHRARTGREDRFPTAHPGAVRDISLPAG